MKPVLFFCFAMMLLALFGFMASNKVFTAAEHLFPNKQSLQQIRLMNETDKMRYFESVYDEVKFSFISFDLANGLTFADIRAIRRGFNGVFYLIIAGLFMIRFLKKPKS